MSDYTPTTDEIRMKFTESAQPQERGAEFDRWLAAHDEQVRADALEEAANLLDSQVPDPERTAAWIIRAYARIARTRGDL